MDNETNQRVDARPTKGFFIHMLTRDVPLDKAIIDLVDNSVDGARRMRSPGDDFSKYVINISCDEGQFSIQDNCGGIPLDVAKNYAFRFGRPSDAPHELNSIGQFGVGMKRTIFKLGQHFYIKSTTQEHIFEIEQSVDIWIKANDWDFEIKNVKQADPAMTESPTSGSIVPISVGTEIKITRLHESVKEVLGRTEFKNQLITDIEMAHALPISDGLQITINGERLRPFDFSLLKSDQITPAREIVPYDLSAGKVKADIVVGIVEEKSRSLAEGGWYIFCNGRMIRAADQSKDTGWGGELNKYHPDYAYFRGFVFLEAEDPSLLPWTTTKSNVDVDSKLYRAVRQKMCNLALPVLGFLRNLAKEKSALSDLKDSDEMEPTLQNAMNPELGATTIKQSRFTDIPPATFAAPRASVSKGSKDSSVRSIQYTRPVAKIEKVMRSLGVKSAKEVGEQTFDYYLSNECE